jgi:Putative Actinobacterial Holin-X, holin superfamily III
VRADRGPGTSVVDLATRLFKAELRQEARNVVRSLGLLVAGAVGMGVGSAFLLLALGLWVGNLVGSTPGGLAIVGGGIALAGAALGFLAIRNLSRQRFAPETARELRRDVEWIQRNGV